MMQVKAAIDRICPPGVLAEFAPIDGSYRLLCGEGVYVRDAVPRRRREFAAGRFAARSALEALGIAPVPIGRDSDRCPIWPEGIVGSISHAAGLAAALVGPSQKIAGIGLDLEEATALDGDLRKHILTPREIANCLAEPRISTAARCKLSFVAKEALFKAVFPITRASFGFQDVNIEFQRGDKWSASFSSECLGKHSDLRIDYGRWSAIGNIIIAVVGVWRVNDPFVVSSDP